MKKINRLLPLLLSIVLLICACAKNPTVNEENVVSEAQSSNSVSVDSIPEFDNKTPYIIINNNQPDFKAEDMVAESFENYGELDLLGRCGTVMASIGKDIMPTEERGSIGQVKPTGWHTVKYDIVDGKYLYNRCHLIGYQLTGENANVNNLITGTRFLNIEGMLPFENMIADYVKETGNHVLYRVTPIFKGNNLLAHGVQLEAKSVEDNGEGICFNIYAYNAQPGIKIDYATGDSSLSNDATDDTEQIEGVTYVINNSSKKFHRPDCKSVQDINTYNKSETTKTKAELISAGYEGCKICNP